MDQFAQRAIVETVTESAVKAAKARAAQSADALRIESETILKRSAAGSAEEIGFERLGRAEAGVADRNAREAFERSVANAAISGEKKRKNSVGDRLEAGSGRSR